MHKWRSNLQAQMAQAYAGVDTRRRRGTDTHAKLYDMQRIEANQHL